MHVDFIVTLGIAITRKRGVLLLDINSASRKDIFTSSFSLIIFKGGGCCQNNRTKLYIILIIEIDHPKDNISCAVR